MLRFTPYLIFFYFLINLDAQAHSEGEKSRFVASQGKDIGKCDNVLRPCKSIAYAVQQANKGDKVLLAAGRYAIDSTEELFYLKSTLVPIYGGYNRFDHFQSQSPQSNITTLTNVPVDMVESLRNKGFNVLADGKSLALNKTLQQNLDNYAQLNNRQSDQPCENGKAGIFECDNVDLQAHLPLSEMSTRPSAGNDIWGHIDLNTGKEFAIMGVYNGVIVVDVSDPQLPVEVGTIRGVNSSWRDVKVYQHFDKTVNLWQAYAYVTTEGSGSGATDYVTIIDLNNLPNAISLVEKNDVVVTAHNIYISNVDHSLNIALPNKTPSLQLIGANNRGGAFQNFSLVDPKTLSVLSKNSYGNGYTHDGASLVIDDIRATNDCGLTSGQSCTLFIDFNEKEMKLWDITNPTSSSQLSTTEYNDVSKSNQYVHSGWGTEDTQYILLHDEFDEYQGGLNTTIRIFSIDSLTNPSQVGQWTGPTKAIDHNGFVRGNRYYFSNYERGLTILDITDPANPSQVGFFDTFTVSNNASFNGAWGVYPFLPSGNILVSDINSGLYILKDNAKNSTKGQFAFNNNVLTTEQGSTLTVEVQRNGVDISEAVAVSFQVIQGSAEANSDYEVDNATLNWAANDNSAKSISVEIKADNTGAEYPENFFIRLYNPENGATLGTNSYAQIQIAGVTDTGVGSFVTNTVTISENIGEYTVDVNRIGSSQGELSFNVELTANEAVIGSDVEPFTDQISWADGENETKQISLTIINDEIMEDNETFSVKLVAENESRIGTHGEIVITIADDDNNIAPTIDLDENFEANVGQLVTLRAQATDDDNDEMTYLWQQTAGDTATITDATSLVASFTAPSNAGTLTFSFTATDFRGAATTATIEVTLIAPTTPSPQTPQTPVSSSGGSFAWLLLMLLPVLYSKTRKR
jgi:choice-of-anchor B domain-containing protein